MGLKTEGGIEVVESGFLLAAHSVVDSEAREQDSIIGIETKFLLADRDGLAVSCRSLGTPTRRPVVCVPEISPKDVVLGIQLNGLFKLGSRIGITMHLKIGRGQVGTRVPRRANA